MEINKLTKEQEQIRQNLFLHSAVADIAINDLGLTLDEPKFFAPNTMFAEYSIAKRIMILDSEFGNAIRLETLAAMSIHLCLLIDCGVDFAKTLAKKSGLLNWKLSDTETVTEEYIEKGLKNQLTSGINGELDDTELKLITHYQEVFIDYCLERMTEEQLLERINSKVETYNKTHIDF